MQARTIRSEFAHFSLTMDISHIRQLGEEPLVSLQAAGPFCSHIHLANCILKDRNSPLYGDMHPGFGVENGDFSVAAVEALYAAFLPLYPKPIEVGVEVICREVDEDAFLTPRSRR